MIPEVYNVESYVVYPINLLDGISKVGGYLSFFGLSIIVLKLIHK